MTMTRRKQMIAMLALLGGSRQPMFAVVVHGKNLRVIGEGTITVRLAKGAGKEAKSDTLKSGGQLDWIELRRAAASQTGKEKRAGAL